MLGKAALVSCLREMLADMDDPRALEEIEANVTGRG